MKLENVTIQQRWYRLDSLRRGHLDRCRLCSKLTIPYLLPPEGTTINDELPTPYQSLGADAVNSLATKLWLTLLPPNNQFFRLQLAPEVARDLEESSPEARTQVEWVLAQMESEVMRWIEGTKLRAPVFKALQYLITVGNALCYIPDDVDYHAWSQTTYGLKVFRLDQFVVMRDPMGTLLELIVREDVSPAVLDAEVLSQLQQSDWRPEDKLPLYTRVWLEDDRYKVQQAVKDVALPTVGEYLRDNLPWLVLRWSHEGDYGRSRVEEYLGDFLSLEALSQAIVEGAAASARLLFLVNPNGLTRPKDLRKARNGDFVPGLPTDVIPLQIQKTNDFQVTMAKIEHLERRLQKAFLMSETIQRNAERVTAFEIQYMAQSLEDALGGVYSLLSQELQLPLIKLVLNRLASIGAIPNLPKAALQPIVTTGLDALGRSHDQNKLSLFLETCTAYLGNLFLEYIKPSDLIERIAINLGIDTRGLVKSEEEIAQARQQAAFMSMAQSISPGVAQELTKGAIKNVQQETQGI